MRLRNLARRIGPVKRLMWHRSAFFDPDMVRVFDIVRPYTMLSGGQLHNAVEVVRNVERRQIPGALVECGVWRGGCSALMAWVGRPRTMWMFDSFEGLPDPGPLDGTEAEQYAGRVVASENDAREVLAKVGVTAEIRKGWFESTVPRASGEIGPIAVLRLDGDWYESTKVCLEHLYDLVSPGGVIILDDYDRWPGCRTAVDEFLSSRKIVVEMSRISAGGGRQFAKP
jgi:hypothetical protein